MLVQHGRCTPRHTYVNVSISYYIGLKLQSQRPNNISRRNSVERYLDACHYNVQRINQHVGQLMQTLRLGQERNAYYFNQTNSRRPVIILRRTQVTGEMEALRAISMLISTAVVVDDA